MRYAFIGLLAASGIAVAWFFAARSLSMFVDRLHTITLESCSPDRFVYDHGTLVFGPYKLSLMTPDYKNQATANIGTSGRVALVLGGKSFAFGPGRAVPSGSGLPIFEFAPDAGDTIHLTYEQSLLSWPVFEINWMTGSSPSWRRHVYCRLVWSKRSRAKLELVWRGQQDYFRWGGPRWSPEKYEIMTNNLLSGGIGEALDLERAAVRYLTRTRRWDRSEYRLESRGPSSDGREEIILALHRDDEQNSLHGAGRSVELRVRYDTREVLREISGQ